MINDDDKLRFKLEASYLKEMKLPLFTVHEEQHTLSLSIEINCKMKWLNIQNFVNCLNYQRERNEHPSSRKYFEDLTVSM